MSKTITTQDGDMLDRICYDYYGYSSGAVEAVLVANPGLADHGTVLEAGLTITLPDIERPQKKGVSIFGKGIGTWKL